MAEVPEPIADRQIALAPILPDAPRFSSVDSALLNLEGQGITLEHFHYPPFETPEYTYPDHKIAIHTRMALLHGLCWAFRTGEWLAEQKPILIKKHGRKAKNSFRYGFDYLRRTLERC